jgi:hypothetical protein
VGKKEKKLNSLLSASPMLDKINLYNDLDMSSEIQDVMPHRAAYHFK